MAVMKATNKAHVPQLEEAIYDAEIAACEDTTSSIDNWPQVQLTYRLDQTDGQGKPITLKQWAKVYDQPGPKSTVYAIFSAALYGGNPIPDDASLDTAELVGKRVRLLWSSYVKKDGTTGIGITKVLPPIKSKAPAVAE